MADDFGRLRIVSGNKIGEAFIIRDGMILGRDQSCDIFISDSSISRKHCQINIRDGRIEIVDLESRNGTKVNGRLIASTILKPADKIEIGDTTLVYETVGIKKKKVSKKLVIMSAIVVVIIITGYFFLEFNNKTKSEEIALHSKQGLEYFKEKRYEEALIEYRYCLKLGAENQTIKNNIHKIETIIEVTKNLEKAQRFIKEGNFTMAEEEVKIILSKLPDNQEALKLQEELTRYKQVTIKIDSAEIFIAQKDYNKGIEILKSLYQQYNDSIVKNVLISALSRKGRYLVSKNKKKEAITVFTEILDIEPAYIEASTEIERLKGTVVAAKPPTIPSEKSQSKQTEVQQPAISKPPEPAEEPKEPVRGLTPAQKSQAEDIYWDAYKAYKDDNDIARARRLCQQVLTIAPDPDFEYYEKAKKLLEKIGE